MDVTTPPLATPETKPGHRVDGRWWTAAVIAAYVFVLVFASDLIGKPKALSLAGAIQMSEHFADLSLFAAARQESDRGGDPYLKNPDDPWGRPFNYPRLWLAFMHFPLSWVPVVGIGLILSFLLGINCWWGALSPTQGVMAGVALCSPPLVLAMERGNSDLIILLLLIAALTALKLGAQVVTWLGVFLAFVLKLYPIVTIIIFLRSGWKQAILGLVLSSIAVIGYLYWQLDEIRIVLRNTPADILMTYGSTHWPKIAEHFARTTTGNHYPFRQFETQSMVWAGVLFLGSCWAGWSRRIMAHQVDARGSLDGFRAGASIYVTTFIAGSSYVYREAFLLLCLPWLWQKTLTQTTARRITLALLFASLWLNSFWWFPLSVGAELANWGLLASLGWWLGETLPPASGDRTRSELTPR